MKIQKWILVIHWKWSHTARSHILYSKRVPFVESWLTAMSQVWWKRNLFATVKGTKSVNTFGQEQLPRSAENVLLCSIEKTMPYGFGTTWGWVNNGRIVIFCCLALSAHDENTYTSSNNEHESGKYNYFMRGRLKISFTPHHSQNTHMHRCTVIFKGEVCHLF